MREDGARRAERAEERDVLRGVREVVDAAHDVRDPHRDVVDADREVVERVAVRAHEDEVVERARRELRPALDDVVHDERLVGDAEAEDELLARGGAAVGFLLRDRARPRRRSGRTRPAASAAFFCASSSSGVSNAR